LIQGGGGTNLVTLAEDVQWLGSARTRPLRSVPPWRQRHRSSV